VRGDLPAAPHARASGRASRDKVRVGRIHIVVNVRCMMARLLYELYMGARDGYELYLYTIDGRWQPNPDCRLTVDSTHLINSKVTLSGVALGIR
jgi:hypothetical protein